MLRSFSLRYSSLNLDVDTYFRISTGNDVARGMLLFGRGRPLGEDGLDWLKVHLVNLHGSLKKASLKERIDYADEKIDEITDSADNPLNVSIITRGGGGGGSFKGHGIEMGSR